MVGRGMAVLSGLCVVCAGLALPGLARGDGSAFGDGQGLSLAPVYADEAPASTAPVGQGAAERTPLMTMFDKLGVGKTMDDWGLKASAYVEGGYTLNFNSPPGNVNAGRSFDFENSAPRLDQLEFKIERDVDPKGKKFDVGFLVEFIYGSDAGFIHSSGLFDYFQGPRSPINQPDLPQAYLTFLVPVGGGLTITVGKSIAQFGQEYVDPTQRPIYSPGLLFNYAVMTSQTGIFTAYNFNDQWSAMIGVDRGWDPDETFKDNNGSPDVLGYVKYAPSDLASLQLNVVGGPEQFNNNSNYRYLFDALANCKPSKDSPWKFAAEGDFAFEQHANVINGMTAYWYGLGMWAGYTVNDYLTINARGEWFRDDGASRTGVDGSFYEATLGVAVTPLPKSDFLKNFVIRPEIRYDYCTQPFFNALSRHDQITFGIDAYLAL